MKSLLTIVITAAIIYFNYILIQQLFHPDPAKDHDIIPGLVRNPWEK
ncbi:MAG: hypothetical protein V4481_02140 [Patescibacteria group bacterium]